MLFNATFNNISVLSWQFHFWRIKKKNIIDNGDKIFLIDLYKTMSCGLHCLQGQGMFWEFRVLWNNLKIF